MELGLPKTLTAELPAEAAHERIIDSDIGPMSLADNALELLSCSVTQGHPPMAPSRGA